MIEDLRGVALEFRSKMDEPGWLNTGDWAIFFGSTIPALLWGVALGNLIRSVRISLTREIARNCQGA